MKTQLILARKGIMLGLVAVAAASSLLCVAARDESNAREDAAMTISPSVMAPAVQLSKAFAAVAAHVSPAVVSVYSEKEVTVQRPEMPFPFPFGDEFFRHFFGGQTPSPAPQGRPRSYRVPQRGMGSGMLLDRAGHILTNYHVVADVDEIKVKTADKRDFKAEILGVDRKTDVAVLKLKGHIPSDLPTVGLGDSSKLEVGDLVIAIGAPFGLTQTVTNGIISAKGRANVGIADFEDFLQTDAPINPGNSGGPLVDMDGNVIGMNAAIATSVGQFSGVGFAIPVDMIRTMLPDLIKGKEITRGMLGVIIQDIDGDLAKHFHLSSTNGALVAQVNDGSPADKAGIEVGDDIVEFDGNMVQDTRHLRNMVAAIAPGSTVAVKVIRDGKPKTIEVTVGTLSETAVAGPAPEQGASRLEKLGLTVQTLTPDLAAELGIENEKGVVITDIQGGSVAALANLQSGDVIVEVDRVRVTNVGELERVLSKSGKKSVLLLVRRHGASIFVVLRP